ncbi:MAG: hypothetical protein ISQ13_04715 [Candidatus Margulisbacteria bacterium]|nr:hypothetical protein [Candidatus Margulisiibacteriota bacterium]
MSKRFFSNFLPGTPAILFTSLLFNCFSLKLFIDIGNYNIYQTLFFFHCLISMVISLLISTPSANNRSFAYSCAHSITALPSFGLICIKGLISPSLLMVYFLFNFSLILTIQFIIAAMKHPHPLFYSFIAICFLWGTSIVIESIPFMYDYLGPLTMSYHYSLITDGVFHISTAVYMALLPTAWFIVGYE